MKNKFIYSPTKSLFEKKLAAGEINEGSIVFIEDTKEIGNRGYCFGAVGSGSGIDPEVLSGIETAIATLQSDKADKSELANYAKKNELPSLDGYLTKTVADGLYATIAQYNTLNQTVGNIQTELSSKLTSSDLAGYAKTADVPTKISDLTDDSDFITNAEATAAYAPKSLVTTVSDQATTISTLATKNELSTGLAGKLDNAAASGFVPTTRKVNGKALDTDITITATDPNAATKESLNNVNTDLQNFKNSVALTYATDKDVADAIANLVDSSPETLNTLDELAAALGDDPNFATTVSNLIGTKASQDALNETNTNVANLTAMLNGKLDMTGGTIGRGLSNSFPLGISSTNAYTGIALGTSGGTGYLLFRGDSTWDVSDAGWNNSYTLLHSGNANKTDVPWAASNILFPKGTSATWNVHTTDAYKGITVLNAIQARPEGAPDDYAVGLSVSGYYGFTLASLGGGDVLLYRRGSSATQTDWKTIAFTDSDITGYSAGLKHSNGTVGAVVNSFGKVGIGTTDPLTKLHVSGTWNSLDNLATFEKNDSYDSRVVIKNSIESLLLAVNNAGNAYLSVGGQHSLVFETNNTARMLINSSGNVGIGTTSPSYKLDVNGSFNATSGNINGNAIIHSGNIGSQSVNYANSAGSANSVAWGNVTGKPSFATVATSGSYNDLSNKPTIPTNTNQLTNGAGFTKNTGTVTSVAMTVPTGLSVSGTPITTSGTLALSFASGYSIPTTAKQGNWDTAYRGGNHASAGYVKSSGVTSVATGTGLTGGTITSTGTISINTTYQGYITNGNNAWASHTKLAANKINAIPVTHKVVTCPISAAGSFAISGTMTAGQVIHVIVQNTTTSAKTVTIPNSGNYISFSGTSLSVPASKYAEINVVYNGEKMFIRTAY